MEYMSLPAVYDTAFQFRNAVQAVDFIEEAVELYGERPVRSVVDIACGTGHYTREFARRDYTVFGVDIQADTCSYTRYRAEAESLTMQVFCGDMVQFSLPQPCGLAVNFFDSLTYVLEHQALIRHFRTVAGNLTPKGLYLIEFGVIDQFGNHNVEEVWTETRGELSVTTTYFRDGFIHPQTRTFSEQCTFRGVCREQCGFFRLRLSKLALYFEEFHDLLRQAGCFAPLACYENFESGLSLAHDELPWRVIAILRKCS